MNTTYKIISKYEDIEPAFWKEIHEFNNMNYFHTKEIIDFYREGNNETFIVAIRRHDKIVAFVSGIIQKEDGFKSYFSRRAIVLGGPTFVKDIEAKEISMLMVGLRKELHSKVIYIEIRNFNDYSECQSIIENTGFKYVPHLNFHLDCRDMDEVKKKMSKSKLRYVKKSLKEGAEIIEAQNELQVEEFYTILENLYRTKVKTPLPDIEFFQTTFKKGLVKYLLIKFQDKIIGGIAAPILENEIIYEWFVCGQDRMYKGVYPSILATWAAIDYGNKNNIKRFDFMGAGKPDEAYGVRDFKGQFGGELVEHGRYLYITHPVLYKLGKKVIGLIKKDK